MVIPSNLVLINAIATWVAMSKVDVNWEQVELRKERLMRDIKNIPGVTTFPGQGTSVTEVRFISWVSLVVKFGLADTIASTEIVAILVHLHTVWLQIVSLQFN